MKVNDLKEIIKESMILVRVENEMHEMFFREKGTENFLNVVDENLWDSYGEESISGVYVENEVINIELE